jgi:hypothetical protein
VGFRYLEPLRPVKLVNSDDMIQVGKLYRFKRISGGWGDGAHVSVVRFSLEKNSWISCRGRNGSHTIEILEKMGTGLLCVDKRMTFRHGLMVQASYGIFFLDGDFIWLWDGEVEPFFPEGAA